MSQHLATSMGRPFLQWRGPTVWTTLALTITASGTFHGELVGVSTFPRHWVYDHRGQLTAKSGLIDFDEWYRRALDLTARGAMRTRRRLLR